MLNALVAIITLIPALFAPGTISGPANDGSPTFAPDGRTLYYTYSGTGAGTILESHLVDGAWSSPSIAPFSGQWNDQHPAIAPDGSFLVFVSTRPVAGESARVAHLWRVDRTATGWSVPVHLPPSVNIGSRIFAPSVAADGSIYFLSIGPKRAFQLFRSRFVSGTYRQAEPLSFSTPATADVDPEIAPDQSYLVFASSGRRGADDTKEHLSFVRANGAAWGVPQSIRYAGDDENGGSNDNEPRIARDGKTLYFSSDRTVLEHFPRTLEQAHHDLDAIQTWNNGNDNVWSIPNPATTTL